MTKTETIGCSSLSHPGWLQMLGPLLYEVRRRADKEWAAAGYDFTVDIDNEMWQAIKEAL